MLWYDLSQMQNLWRFRVYKIKATQEYPISFNTTLGNLSSGHSSIKCNQTVHMCSLTRKWTALYIKGKTAGQKHYRKQTENQVTHWDLQKCSARLFCLLMHRAYNCIFTAVLQRHCSEVIVPDLSWLGKARQTRWHRILTNHPVYFTSTCHLLAYALCRTAYFLPVLSWTLCSALES